MLKKDSILLLKVAAITVILVICALLSTHSNGTAIFLYLIFCCVLLAILGREDYLNPAFSYLLPWLVVILFLMLPISDRWRDINNKTMVVVLTMQVIPIFVWTVFSGESAKIHSASSNVCRVNDYSFNRIFYWGFVVLFIVLTILNVAFAGYVPLIRGLRTGDTGYFKFGIGGIYGLYNAYANALGILSLFLYFLKKDKIYLAIYTTILIVFFLFVSRQNIISVVLEGIVIYSFFRGRVSLGKIAMGGLIAMIAFAAVGDFRSGDIRELVGIKQTYNFLPDFFVWIYAYGYFNILNLDNVISNPGVPFFDGQSLSALIPSFIRPEYESAGDLEVINFTVKSFISPLYADVGLPGAMIFIFFVFIIYFYLYKRLNRRATFLTLSSFSVLYFCGFFSFFSNFWFYLPVIFQIPFFFIFSKFVIKKRRVLDACRF